MGNVCAAAAAARCRWSSSSARKEDHGFSTPHELTSPAKPKAKLPPSPLVLAASADSGALWSAACSPAAMQEPPVSAARLKHDLQASAGDHVPASPPSKEQDVPAWRKGRELGRGGYGQVFLALDEASGDFLAVKVLPIPHREDDSLLQQHVASVTQEIALLSKLSHPHIIQYKGCQVVTEHLNIFMEYAPGGSLEGLLRGFKSQGLPESVIRVFTRHILEGLAYIHSKNVIHRDIKAANLLLDKGSSTGSGGPQFVVKLADFGASKQLHTLASMSQSCAAKTIKGTPYWMPPEVIRGTGHGCAADIWSLACTIIEMATGQPPWADVCESPNAAMFHIATSKDLPRLPAKLSPEAHNFLCLCLNRVPKDRPDAATLLRHPFVAATATGASGMSAACVARSRRLLTSPYPMSPATAAKSSIQQQAPAQQAAASGAAADGDDTRPPQAPAALPSGRRAQEQEQPVDCSDAVVAGSVGAAAAVVAPAGTELPAATAAVTRMQSNPFYSCNFDGPVTAATARFSSMSYNPIEEPLWESIEADATAARDQQKDVECCFWLDVPLNDFGFSSMAVESPALIAAPKEGRKLRASSSGPRISTGGKSPTSRTSPWSSRRDAWKPC